MPETPLPARPDFDFFAAPDVSTDRDEGDEAAPIVYPYRQDFEADVIAELTDELSALTAQLETARLAYHAAYQALVTDNPWRTAEVIAGLREIGAALGVE